MTPLPSGLGYLLAVTTVAAAIYDLRFRKIPNWLSVAALLSGLVLRILYGGWEGARIGAGGFAVAFGVYFVFYLIRAMRAGDVKLMGAVGAIAGYSNWYVLFILTSIFGGIVAIVVVLYQGRFNQTMANVAFIVGEIAHGRKPHESRPALDVGNEFAVTLPHGFVIALGSLLFLCLSAFLGSA